MFLKTLRRILRRPEVTISLLEALEVARTVVEGTPGMTWKEPVSAKERLDSYVFSTNGEMLGDNISVVVSVYTGEVESVAVSPR